MPTTYEVPKSMTVRVHTDGSPDPASEATCEPTSEAVRLTVATLLADNGAPECRAVSAAAKIVAEFPPDTPRCTPHGQTMSCVGMRVVVFPTPDHVHVTPMDDDSGDGDECTICGEIVCLPCRSTVEYHADTDTMTHHDDGTQAGFHHPACHRNGNLSHGEMVAAHRSDQS